MFGEKDLPNGLTTLDECSVSKLTRFSSERNKDNPDKKMGFLEKGIDFLRESKMVSNGF